MKQLLPTIVRFMAARVLPYRNRQSSPNISNVHTIPVDDSTQLKVYWLASGTEAGPAASLMIFDDEVMRFDCLGPDQGHMHFNMKQHRAFHGETVRLYYAEATVEEQIERSCFELENNLDFAIRTNFSRRVRLHRIDAAQLASVSAKMGETMKNLVKEQKAARVSNSTDSQTMNHTPQESSECIGRINGLLRVDFLAEPVD